MAAVSSILVDDILESGVKQIIAASAAGTATTVWCFLGSFSTSVVVVCTVTEAVTPDSARFSSLEADDLLKLHLLFSLGVVAVVEEEAGVAGFSVVPFNKHKLVVHFSFSLSLSLFPVNKFLSHLPVLPISFKTWIASSNKMKCKIYSHLFLTCCFQDHGPHLMLNLAQHFHCPSTYSFTHFPLQQLSLSVHILGPCPCN